MSSYKQELDPPLSLKGFVDGRDFRTLGLHDMAYIRRQGECYMIHAADGTQISSADDHDGALAEILGNNLELISVH